MLIKFNDSDVSNPPYLTLGYDPRIGESDRMHKIQSWAPSRAKSAKVVETWWDPKWNGGVGSQYIKLAYFTTQTEGDIPIAKVPKGTPRYLWNSPDLWG